MKMIFSDKINLRKYFIISLAVTLVCLLGCQLTGELSLREVSQNLFYIVPKAAYSPHTYFKLEEIQKLQKLFPKLEIAYEYKEIKKIQANGHTAEAKVISINDTYPKLRHIIIEQGRFFSEERSSRNEAMISRKLAFDLFKSNNVIGESVEYQGEEWKITGIVGRNKKYKDDTNILYISKIPKQQENNIYISGLYMHDKENPTLEVRKQAELLIEKTGRDKKDYDIIDLHGYAAEISQKYKVILFILALIILVQLYRAVISLIKNYFILLKEEMKQYYLFEYIIKSRRRVLIFLGIISLVFIISLFCLKIFEVFIISLPKNSSNFLEALLVKLTLTHRLGNIALLPESLRMLYNLNKLGTFFCGTGCLSVIVMTRTFKVL
jgi:hypothetical protein